jgi:serpin B
MKPGWVFISSLVILIALGRICDAQPAAQQTRWETVEPERTLAQAGNDLGFDLFRELNKTDTGINLLISPLSVAAALTMTYNGATGETKTAMENTLHLAGLEIDDINRTYKSLFAFLQQPGNGIQLEIANSIWHRRSLPVKEIFLAVNTEYHEAKVQALDFDDPQAVGIINDWVAAKTHGKISEVIRHIDPIQQLFLINAVYFKGQWRLSFSEHVTTSQPFFRADGTSIQCRLMTQDDHFSYRSNDDFQAIELPFVGRGYSMTIVLPAKETDIDTIINSLNRESWAADFGNLSPAYGRILIPQFEFQYAAGLKNQLGELGMSECFREGANFKNISDVPLFIDDVLHKTYIKTDEKGAEAAAVTSVEIALCDMGTTPKLEFTMRVDRPFLFVIHERMSGAILFLGKVLDPTAG